MSDSENTTLPSKQSKRWRVWVGLTLLLLVVLTGLWWWMQQKSVGTISTPLAEQDEKATVPSMTEYQGKYFTFLYPAGFEDRSAGDAVKFPLLERGVLSKNDIEGRKVVVLVQDTTGYTLEEYGSYRLRDMDTKAYTKEKVELGGRIYTLFVKNESVFEAGAFWQSGSRVASIVISSPFAADLRQALTDLLATLEPRS